MSVGLVSRWLESPLPTPVVCSSFPPSPVPFLSFSILLHGWSSKYAEVLLFDVLWRLSSGFISSTSSIWSLGTTERSKNNYTAVNVSHRHVQLVALESLHEFLDFGVKAIGDVYGLLTGVLLVHESVCT